MTPTAARVAGYILPDPETPFGAAMQRWFAGPPAGADQEVWRAATARPRRYGPHMTLWAPTRRRADVDVRTAAAALANVAAALPPPTISALTLVVADGVLALKPVGDGCGLRRVCDVVVAAMDPFRAPLRDAEYARRAAAAADDAARERLARWGYPHVGDGFEPHFTLAGGNGASSLADAGARSFAGALDDIRTPDLSLMIEPAPGAAFATLLSSPFGADAMAAAALNA